MKRLLWFAMFAVDLFVVTAAARPEVAWAGVLSMTLLVLLTLCDEEKAA